MFKNALKGSFIAIVFAIIVASFVHLLCSCNYSEQALVTSDDKCWKFTKRDWVLTHNGIVFYRNEVRFAVSDYQMFFLKTNSQIEWQEAADRLGVELEDCE